MSDKTFTVCVRVTGGLISSFVFENNQTANVWLLSEFPKLQAKYGKLSFHKSSLPGLKVGDRCNVYGEALDVFKIERLIRYSEDRYGFVLDSGFSEEVAKCHTEFL